MITLLAAVLKNHHINPNNLSSIAVEFGFVGPVGEATASASLCIIFPLSSIHRAKIATAMR
jgi:hypothetical protein